MQEIHNGKNGPIRGVVRASIIAIAAVVVLGALHIAAVAVLPIVVSLILCALFWPVREWLTRWMPAWIGAALCSVVMVAVLAAVVGWGWYASDSATETFRESQEEYVEEYRDLRSWLTKFGVPEESVPEVSELQDATNGGEMQPLLPNDVWRQVGSVVIGGLRSVLGVFAAVLLTIFLSYLALLEGHRWQEWAREHLSPKRYAVLSDIVRDSASHVRWYFLGKTTSGLISGTATWLWLWAMGVPLAFVWGVFTLFMNYIPNIGALVSGLPPTILAIVELGWTKGLIVATGLFVIETVVGNLVDPAIQGRMLRLSIFVTLASLIVWGWIWGVAGAVLAPVLTAILLTAVARVREHEHSKAPLAQ